MTGHTKNGPWRLSLDYWLLSLRLRRDSADFMSHQKPALDGLSFIYSFHPLVSSSTFEKVPQRNYRKKESPGSRSFQRVPRSVRDTVRLNA